MRNITVLAVILFTVTTFNLAFSQEKKTIKREIDPITIQGSSLAALSGSDISKLRLFASGSKGMEPIPFQIDERDGKGTYVMTAGKSAGKDEDGGKLDNNDELIFISRDLGDKAPSSSFPKGAKNSMEITVTDPIDGSKGYVYLFSFDSPPAKSKVDYVSFDPASGKVTGRTYIIGYHPKDPITQTFLASTVDKVNLSDTYKLRLNIAIKGGIKFNKTQEDFSSKLAGYIDGPVRVTRRVASSMKVMKLPTPKVESDTFFWPDLTEMPATVKVPFDVSKLFKSMVFISTNDLNEKAIGATFYNSNNKGGLKIDGKMDENEKKMSLEPVNWGATQYKNLASFFRVEYGASLKGTRAEQYYVDDKTLVDDPENVPGQIGNAGTNMKGLETLKKGSHKFNLITYYPKSYKPGDEKWILNIVDKKLKVSVAKGN